MEGLADQLVDYAVAVVLRGIDVVDAGFDGRSEDGDGFVTVAGRSEDTVAGQLHGSVSAARNHHISQRIPVIVRISQHSARTYADRNRSRTGLTGLGLCGGAGGHCSQTAVCTLARASSRSNSVSSALLHRSQCYGLCVTDKSARNPFVAGGPSEA